jgi:hypothetical protein
MLTGWPVLNIISGAITGDFYPFSPCSIYFLLHSCMRTCKNLGMGGVDIEKLKKNFMPTLRKTSELHVKRTLGP